MVRRTDAYIAGGDLLGSARVPAAPVSVGSDTASSPVTGAIRGGVGIPADIKPTLNTKKLARGNARTDFA